MIELPFRIDKPIAIACAMAFMMGLFLFLRHLLNKKEGRIYAVTKFALSFIWHRILEEKRMPLFRKYLLGMAVIWGGFSLAGFLIGAGVFKSKPRAPVDRDAFFEKMRLEHGLEKRNDPFLDKRREEYLNRRKESSSQKE